MCKDIKTGLPFRASDLSRVYGVNLRMKKGDETQHLRFKTEVIYGGLVDESSVVFQYTKSDIHINNSVPDDHPYRVANLCNQAFYPLLLVCNARNEIQGFRADDLLERWKKKRKEIEEQFSGEFLVSYLDNTEQSLYNTDKVHAVYQHDLFVSLFFSPVYGISHQQPVAIEPAFPLIPYIDPIGMKGTEWVQEIPDYEHAFLLIREGKYNDPRNMYQLFPGAFMPQYNEEYPDGDFRVEYEISKRDYLIESINGHFILFDGGDPLIETNIEVHYLEEYPVEPLAGEGELTPLIPVEGPGKKKKSFIDHLFHLD